MLQETQESVFRSADELQSVSVALEAGQRDKEKVNRPCPGHVLDIDVGTDEHVTEEKDFSLLRLEDLSSFAIHHLNQCLAKDQRALLRVQQLKERQGRHRLHLSLTKLRRPITCLHTYLEATMWHR